MAEISRDWTTEQPNFGNRHLRSVDDLTEGMNIIVHTRQNNTDHKRKVHIETIDRDLFEIKLCETNDWLALYDYGVIPTFEAETAVWSRYNWLERA